MSGDILFLVHRAPWPPDRGDRIRSWHMVEALLRLGPVHVAALADNRADADAARNKLEPLCASVHIAERQRSRATALMSALWHDRPASVEAFVDGSLHTRVRELVASGSIDRIVAFSSQMAQYVPDDFSGRFLMDFVDVDSAKFEQFGTEAPLWSPMGWVQRREGRLLARYEAQVARRADWSSFVSAAEAQLFRQRSGLGEGKVHALDNGIDLARFSPDGDWVPLDPAMIGKEPLIVFTGQMDYQPNIDAVAHFARQILPAIREVAAARFAIVGRAPTAEVRALAALSGVHVTGEVPDTRPWLAAADVVVAPLQLARGVQNKLLEAMAMGRAIVASPGAAEGIDAENGRHLIVADGAKDTADAVLALIADPARRATLGSAARARMVDRYAWEATLAPLGAWLP